MKTKNILIVTSVVLLLLVVFGCSRKKNRFTSRAYHNTTSRYNWYFNANEIKKANETKLYEQHQDDYSEILPLFIYPTEEQSKAMYPDMDAIIEKTSTLIHRHSMFIKKEEHNRWVDDSYMLMGIARFYKYEHYIAEEVFEYVAKAYKKKDERFLALVWLARTYMEVDDMNKAESYLTLIDEQGCPKQYKSIYNAVYADYYIRKRNYDDAISRLEKSIKFTKKRKDKRRYNYVLAQLWLKKKEYSKASEYFTAVIKLKPEYDMMFNAKISRALSFDNGSEDSEGIKKMLKKMVKDKKNVEFLDQIYYALADIAFKEDDEPLGIKYLQKSAAMSVSNNKQKALSYLRLGELFYEKPDYLASQAYYDSCLTVLPEDYERFDQIEARTKSLTELVKNILIVEKQDSLQKLAGDEAYRQKVIADLIEQAKEEERLKEIEEQSNVILENNIPDINANVNNTGKWYFYNQTTMGFGFTDFKQNWGNRKLEDNWRRSNKTTVATFEDDLVNLDSIPTDSAGNKINPKTTEEYYLAQIPLNDSALNISHNKIIEALYAMGNIYRENFQDYKNAIISFEDLVARYDTCRYKLPSWYNLYRISLLIDDDVLKEKYKRLILDNYPDSEYARIIQDPTYNKVTRENRKRVNNYYSIVYDIYRNRAYEKVLIRCEKAKSIFADNHIQDRFDFLAAMAIGHTNVVDSFKLALQNVITRHPQSEVSVEAKRILDLIEKGVDINLSEDEPGAIKVPYTHKFNDEFHFVLMVPGKDKKTNKYKVDISNFNQKYYSKKSLNVSNIMVDPTTQIIIVKKMQGYDAAIDYYKSFKLNKEQLTDINATGYQYFLISKENFILFYKNKDIKGYTKFFKKNFEVEL